MNMPINDRTPDVRSTPQGAVQDDGDWGVLDFLRVGIPPPNRAIPVQPRLVNAAQINAVSGALPTESGPDFLDRSAIFISDFGKAYKETFDEFVAGLGDSGKKLGAGAGGVVTGLFPWWFWALVGLALFAWIVGQIAPLLKKTA